MRANAAHAGGLALLALAAALALVAPVPALAQARQRPGGWAVRETMVRMQHMQMRAARGQPAPACSSRSSRQAAEQEAGSGKRRVSLRCSLTHAPALRRPASQPLGPCIQLAAAHPTPRRTHAPLAPQCAPTAAQSLSTMASRAASL